MCIYTLIRSMKIDDDDPNDEATIGHNQCIDSVLRVIKKEQNEGRLPRAVINRTVQSIAEHKYPNQTFDTALPHGWCCQMRLRGFEPVGHFVTLYPTGSIMNSYMAPITDQGVEMAARVASMEA